MIDDKSLELNHGGPIPKIGLGTWRSEQGKVGQSVKVALESGYRHIDCAAIYGNEVEVGEALEGVFSSGTVSREEVFITSKLWNTEHHSDDVIKACKKTLADLKLDYLDLYLIHWGIAFAQGNDSHPLDDKGVIKTAPVSIQQTWQAMEKLVEQGLVKSVGVSNFTTTMLVDLLSYAEIVPAVNQIEIHPYNSQLDLVDFCRHKNIEITAYSPLGSNSANTADGLLNHSVVKEISDAHGATPAQVLIAWGLARDLIVIPKSVNEARIKENLASTKLELSESDMEKLASLNKNQRYVNPIEWWGLPYFD